MGDPPAQAAPRRKVAGVAAGIGERYGIDPVVPRVLFAVLTFYGGSGLLLYVLGWLLLPEEDDEVSPVESLAGKGRSATSSFFTIMLVLALIPLTGWFFDKDMAGFFGLLAGGGLLFLLHQRRAHLGKVPEAPAQAPEPAYPVYPDPVPEAPMTSAQPELDDAHHRPTTPPAWDPLGAAPFAWDLPEPSRPEPEAEPPVRVARSKAGLVTIGVSLLAIGGLVLAEPVLGGWVSAPHVIGVVLGVLGVGMVLGSFRRGGRGLIGLAAPLAAVGIAMTVAWPDGFESGGMGDLAVRPSSIAQVAPVYTQNVGSVDVDLTGLVETEGSFETRAAVDLGDVRVVVPETADVVVRCEVGLGDVQCLDQSRGGSSPVIDVTDYGPDGPGGLKIELHAEVNGPGSVEVSRG
ncbi:PspC domain-containing protein [Actinokineospora soli]|uniref:PspC domain-containing protein n=1 Tax=Actinokineospora soli TaxID=1048753 RepID=A0ABW2TY73_9PSEU